MLLVWATPLTSGAPATVNSIHWITLFASFDSGTCSTPPEMTVTMVNKQTMANRYSGASRITRDTANWSQSTGRLRPLSSLVKNRNPVIMKNMATLVWPKWVYRFEGAAFHSLLRRKKYQMAAWWTNTKKAR
jgi:hypothetical protein